jgi:drug/metabolite transporter (DMT)-like permease
LTTPETPRSASGRTVIVDVALVATVLIWGVNFSVVKATLAHLPPLAFNTIRLVGASLCLLTLTRFVPGPPIASGDGRRFLFLGLVGHTAYQLLFIHGIDSTTASNSAILLGLTPVFVAMLSFLLNKDQAGAGAWLGIAISVLGVYLVLSDSLRLGGSLAGDALTLAATFCWSLHTVLSRPLVARYGPLRASAYTLSLGTLFFLPFGLPALARIAPASVPASAWWGTFYSLFFALVAAYFMWYYAVERIGPTQTAVYSNLTPVAALVVAYLALGEAVGRHQLLGALVIFVGIYLVRRGRVEASGFLARVSRAPAPRA